MAKKIEPTHLGSFVKADFFDVCDNIEPESIDLVFMDPMYDDHGTINDAIDTVDSTLVKNTGAVICFMYPETVQHLIGTPPGQIAHWVKPVSTKNTVRRYSRFIEAICIWHGTYFNQDLHWSNRTGVFTDTIVEKEGHPFQKPYSLVEKLVLLHCPPGGTILDPFCGSKVVKKVADNHGFKSLSIDIKDYDKEK